MASIINGDIQEAQVQNSLLSANRFFWNNHGGCGTTYTACRRQTHQSPDYHIAKLFCIMNEHSKLATAYPLPLPPSVTHLTNGMNPSALVPNTSPSFYTMEEYCIVNMNPELPLTSWAGKGELKVFIYMRHGTNYFLCGNRPTACPYAKSSRRIPVLDDIGNMNLQCPKCNWRGKKNTHRVTKLSIHHQPNEVPVVDVQVIHSSKCLVVEFFVYTYTIPLVVNAS